MSQNLVPFAVRLPPEIAAKLRARATEDGRKPAPLIRHIVTTWLNNGGSVPTTPPVPSVSTPDVEPRPPTKAMAPPEESVEWRTAQMRLWQRNRDSASPKDSVKLNELARNVWEPDPDNECHVEYTNDDAANRAVWRRGGWRRFVLREWPAIHRWGPGHPDWAPGIPWPPNEHPEIADTMAEHQKKLVIRKEEAERWRAAGRKDAPTDEEIERSLAEYYEGVIAGIREREAAA